MIRRRPRLPLASARSERVVRVFCNAKITATAMESPPDFDLDEAIIDYDSDSDFDEEQRRQGVAEISDDDVYNFDKHNDSLEMVRSIDLSFSSFVQHLTETAAAASNAQSASVLPRQSSVCSNKEMPCTSSAEVSLQSSDCSIEEILPSPYSEVSLQSSSSIVIIPLSSYSVISLHSSDCNKEEITITSRDDTTAAIPNSSTDAANDI